MPLPDTAAEPPVEPPTVTPLAVKPVTGALKTAVKLIGEILVGSAWADAWSIVTVGPVVVKVTVLSVLVEAELPLLDASNAAPAGIETVTVPSEVMPLTATL